MRKSVLYLFSDRPVLSLAFFCLLVFAVSTSWVTIPDTDDGLEKLRQKTELYVEFVNSDDFPVMFRFGSLSEIRDRFSAYEFSNNLRNGDKLTFDDGKFTLSKIGGKKSLALGIPININSAGVDDLIVLPGIGKVLAQRIVEHRILVNVYSTVDELIAVKGIGPKKLSALRELISAD